MEAHKQVIGEDLHQKILDPTITAQPSAAPSPPILKEGDEAPKNEGMAAVTAAAGDGTVTETEKKVRRAERFGMPVMLSEAEKRSSRAERFATGPSLHGTINGNLEEQKRKARAERFGLATNSVSDEEAKKKARVERFVQDSKPDTLEEEKKKARAARFSQTHTASPASNGNGKPELKKNVA